MDVLIGHYWTMSDIYERDNAACIKYLNLKRSRKLFLAVLLIQLCLSHSPLNHIIPLVTGPFVCCSIFT